MAAPPRILIADDHPLFRLALSEAVRSALPGARLEQTSTLGETIAALEAGGGADLVLLDLMMPGAMGFSGLLCLRVEHPETPVAIVSGVDDPRVIRKALHYGASGYIPKSLSPAGISAAGFEPIARERGVAFRVKPTSLIVRSDPRMLRRMVQNLVSNAIRYTPKGRVVLGARRRGGRARIEVWDTGLGIDPGDIRDIFREFRRLRSPAADGAMGLGIGLAIVDRMSRVLDHPVDVRSTPGRGSMFAISAPVTGRAERARPAAVAEAARLPPLRVVCIDNEPSIVEGAQSLLRAWGLTVIGATGTAEALARARAGAPPDVLLADYHLDGGETGLDAAAAFRAAYGASLPAVIVSADQTDIVKRLAAEAGCRFLAKPLRPAALRALLASLAAQREPAS